MSFYIIWACIVIFGFWLYAFALSALRRAFWGHRGWELTDLIVFPIYFIFEAILLIINLFTLFTIAQFVYGELRQYRRQ